MVTDEGGDPLAGVNVEVIGSQQRTTSDTEGRFRLRLPPGTWRLRFSQIAYEPRSVELTLERAGHAPLSVRLERAPIQLRGLTVEGARTPALGKTVTTETVRQVPPLGEPDVFRAIVLLPGVSQPNDLQGRIHLAGGSSDETGVRLDSHPLQDPFHLLGLMGAFNVAALERADVLIHHLPASMGGRLSGTIDLVTREPDAEKSMEAVVSLLSSSATYSGADLPGGLDVLASGRVTYLDKLVELARSNIGSLRELDIPLLGYHDALLRIGRSWDSLWRAEALAFTTGDTFRELKLQDIDGYEPLTWGESLVGLRLTRSGTDWTVAARTSFDRAGVSLDERPTGRSHMIESERDWWSSSVELSGRWTRWRADVGAALDHRTTDQRWVARGLIDEVFSPNTPAEYEGVDEQTTAALYGTAGFDLGRRWSAAAGARLWHAGGKWYPAPRARLTFRAGDDLEVHAAVNRRFQFDSQLEEPIEGSITTPRFLLASPRRADVAAFALDWRRVRLPFGGQGTLEVQAFGKRYPDRTVLPARNQGQVRDDPGEAYPDFRRIRGRSIGATAGWQFHWNEDWVLQGSYTWQRVREEYEAGEWSPTSWDAPHTLSLFASMPFLWEMTLNVAYQVHSGRATTPVVARSFEPRPDLVSLMPRFLEGERNSIRVPPYMRLDVGFRYGFEKWGADCTLFLQVLNLLFRANPIDYNWRVYFSDARQERTGGGLGGGAPRAGRSGLPIIPSLGLEVKW